MTASTRILGGRKARQRSSKSSVFAAAAEGQRGRRRGGLTRTFSGGPWRRATWWVGSRSNSSKRGEPPSANKAGAGSVRFAHFVLHGSLREPRRHPQER